MYNMDRKEILVCIAYLWKNNIILYIPVQNELCDEWFKFE